jgi:hypothetical protein
MAILKTLILKIRIELTNINRYAYALLSRFVQLEPLWLVYLRSQGFGDFPVAKKARTVKIFTAILKLHERKNFIPSFFRETDRHFMSLK